MCSRQAVLSKYMPLLKCCPYMLTGGNWHSFFSPLGLWKRWRFQFIQVKHLFIYYIYILCFLYISEKENLWSWLAVHIFPCGSWLPFISIIQCAGQHACWANVLFFHFVSVRSKTFLQIGHCSPYPLTDVSTCLRQG